MIELDFVKSSGLIPVIAQDYQTGEVLMLAYMNAQAFEATLKTGIATYYSRSRQSLWVKGETSGHVQQVREIRVDCDRDTLLLKVNQVGPGACHEGYRSCFFSRIQGDTLEIAEPRQFNPADIYKKKDTDNG